MASCACCAIEHTELGSCTHCGEAAARFCSRLCHDYYHGNYSDTQAPFVSFCLRVALGRPGARTHAASASSLPYGNEEGVLSQLFQLDLPLFIRVLLDTKEPFETLRLLKRTSKAAAELVESEAFFFMMEEGMRERDMIGAEAHQRITGFLRFVSPARASTPLAIKLLSPMYHLVWAEDFSAALADEAMMARYPHALRWSLWQGSEGGAPLSRSARRILYLEMLFRQHSVLSRAQHSVLSRATWSDARVWLSLRIDVDPETGKRTLISSDTGPERISFPVEMLQWDHYPNVGALFNARYENTIPENMLVSPGEPIGRGAVFATSEGPTGMVEYWTINDPVFFRWSWGEETDALSRIRDANKIKWTNIVSRSSSSSGDTKRELIYGKITRLPQEIFFEKSMRILQEIFFADDMGAYYALNEYLNTITTIKNEDAGLINALESFVGEIRDRDYADKDVVASVRWALAVSSSATRHSLVERILSAYERDEIESFYLDILSEQHPFLGHQIRDSSGELGDTYGFYPELFYEWAGACLSGGNTKFATWLVKFIHNQLLLKTSITYNYDINNARDTERYSTVLRNALQGEDILDLLQQDDKLKYFNNSADDGRVRMLLVQWIAMSHASSIFQLVKVTENFELLRTGPLARKSTAKFVGKMREYLRGILWLYFPTPGKKYERALFDPNRVREMVTWANFPEEHWIQEALVKFLGPYNL